MSADKLVRAFCTALTLSSPMLATAQVAQDTAAAAYPARNARILVGFAAGGGTDVMARLFAQRFAESFGQTFVVDNRPGAGGNIATELAAKASPDGHTLIMAVSSHAINVTLYARPPYDAVRDFAPVSLVALAPNMLVAHPSLPIGSIKDLIALAKEKPGELVYSSPGSGTAQHLAMEYFRSMAGIKLLHVPYNGGAPAIAAALAGQVQLHTNSLPTNLPHIKAGRLRALGVTSAQRSQIAPDIPTVAEAAALPRYEASVWYGLLAPAGTPIGIIRKLNAEVQKQIQHPDVHRRMLSLGFEPFRNTPEAYLELIKSDVVKWGKVVRDSGAKVD
ncbi:MAG: tripartite tricarboxylate transporter substrate binding protein [Burkholderiales bacterium]|nr:tripartite tricarboxylate transporter substrate binding protein [Burkholderiales bacterium]